MIRECLLILTVYVSRVHHISVFLCILVERCIYCVRLELAFKVQVALFRCTSARSIHVQVYWFLHALVSTLKCRDSWKFYFFIFFP